MWKQYNPNPKGKQVGDCTVRAIAKVTGKNWDETYIGISLQGFIEKDMPSANAVTTNFLKQNGFKRRTIPGSCPDCYTVKDFCADHPTGTYLLGIGSHVVAVEDGDYWDSWDSGEENPVYYFEKTEE